MPRKKPTPTPDPNAVDLLGPWPPIPAPVVATVPLTRARAKLVEAAVTIAQTAPDIDKREIAYLARQLVQCTLPHTNPGDVPQWVGRSHTITIGIQPGRDFDRDVSIGYPYGSLPRLLLFWMNTEAKRTGSRRLFLGQSLAQFMRELGLDPSSGGKKSDAYRLREQMRRLCACTISFQQTTPDGQGQRWLDMKVATKGESWWHTQNPAQAGLWESWIELGEAFYNAIIASPVPVDMRALRALKRSPLALDVYAWASLSTFNVTRHGAPRFVPWRALAQQFGAEYTDVKNFRKHALAALRKVQRVYPAFNFRLAPGGLTVHPSLPAIAPKDDNR
jgi:hypothetical protein